MTFSKTFIYFAGFFMEAYRDTILKQSKQAHSISFYVTIELLCLLKKINTFLSNTKSYFLFHELCLKYTEVYYISASFTAQSKAV